MASYKIKCQDGSDRHCEKLISVKIDIVGLTQEQLEDIIRDEGCMITEKQVKDSFVELDDEEKKTLKEHGNVFYSTSYIDTICSACGSDYDRDDDGNILV